MLLLRPRSCAQRFYFAPWAAVPDKMPDLRLYVWIGAGDQDPIIPPSETQRLVELLRRAGAEVTIRFFNAGHGLTSDEIETAGRWLKDLKLSDVPR